MKVARTVREIRRILFETNYCTEVGLHTMTNKESRDYFYAIVDQDLVLNVIDDDNYLLIWNPKHGIL